jgi:ABC-type phosphate transport system auxiliary subunit
MRRYHCAQACGHDVERESVCVCVQKRAAALEKEVDAANRLAAMMERRVSMLEHVLRRERAERPSLQVATVAAGAAETEAAEEQAAEEAALNREIAATRRSMLSAQKDHACASECVPTRCSLQQSPH